MIVWVDDEIFSKTVRDVDLIALLRVAALRRHSLIISQYIGQSYSQRASPHFASWLKTLPARIFSEVDMLHSRFRMISANSVTHGSGFSIAVSPIQRDFDKKICYLGVSEAIRALALPLHIMVENQINDGAFLRAVIPPIWIKRIEDWERTGELRFVQGGGNAEIARLVEYHSVDERSKKAFGLPSRVWNLSHFVVYDHDGHSENSPGEGAVKLDRICVPLVGSYRLRRKTQEHYLSISALERIVNSRVTDVATRKQLLQEISNYSELGQLRYFAKLPQIGENIFFKNEFSKRDDWSGEVWLEEDVTKEMTELAERIASAV